MTLSRYETVDEYGVTVGFMTGRLSVAVCNVTRLPQYWWVARVFVKSDYRRQQLGSACLRRAIELIGRQEGPERIVVAPGGYSTPRHVQRAFYLVHGFVGDDVMERPVFPCENAGAGRALLDEQVQNATSRTIAKAISDNADAFKGGLR